MSVVIEGNVEGLGRTTLMNSIGIDVRTDKGELISIPVEKDQLQNFASLLFKRVRISVEEVK